MSDEKRREERLRVRVPAEIVRGKERVTLLTDDVSYRGLFLRTDSPAAVRRLLQMNIELPSANTRIRLHGMVVHSRRPGETGELPPGMGVELVSLAGEAKYSWEGFVTHLRPPATKGSLDAIQAVGVMPITEPVRRRFERHKTELRLLVDGVGELDALVATNVSERGMFVATTLPLPIGHGFRVTVVHPETGATYPLDCVIRRRDLKACPPGVGVEFDVRGEGERTSFLEFIRNELPVLSATEEEIDEETVDAWEEEETTLVRKLRG